MGLIGVAVDELGADQIGHLLLEIFGHENAPTQRFMPRIGERQIGLHRRLAVPHGQHAHAVGDVLHRDLGAQLVEAELVGEVLRQRAGRIDQEAAAMAGRGFGDQEIGRDLALRRQQRAEPAKAGLQQRNVCGDEAVEEVAGILAADLDHAPVWKKRCFH